MDYFVAIPAESDQLPVAVAASAHFLMKLGGQVELAMTDLSA